MPSTNPPPRKAIEQADGLELWLSLLAHDVRAPLQTIEGYAQILDGELAHPEHRHALEHIQVAGAQIRELLQAVLAAHRTHPDAKSEPVRDTIDLAQVLKDAATRARGPANLRGVTISTWKSNTPLAIVGHPVKARHALLNVLTNAVVHGGGVVTVEAPIIEHDYILVTVRDEGPGLPSTARITPPKTEPSSATKQPTRGGRGLHLAASLMRDMAGSLRYAPSATHPGTFVLRFRRVHRPTNLDGASQPAHT